MKILQNETTNNNSTTTSTTTTPNSKEKQQHHHQQQHPPHSSPLSHFVEKRKAKTLKNKILQNVAQQQQQQEELYQQQQQQQLQQNDSINNSSNYTPSAMTDERTKANKNKSNSNKTNNSNITADNKVATTSTSSATVSNLLKDSLTDSSSCNSGNKNNCNNNNNSDLIIAEAAKILLKNGLNGTNAAAAAAVATATATLLTAAANFHNLPTANNSSSSLSEKSNLARSASSSIASEKTALDASNVKTAAAAAHAQLVAIAAAAAAVNATNKRLAAPPFSSSISTSSTTSSSSCKSPNQTVNNGLLVNTGGVQATSATTTPPTAAATTTTTTHFTKPYKTSSCRNTMSSSMDTGIIDYTINSNSNNNNASLSPLSSSSSVINLSGSAHNINSGSSTSNAGQNKFLNNNNIHSHSNRSDIGRTPISQHHQQHHNQTSNVNNHKNPVVGGVGGRLQFFKDGKFILELARSKDGEKGGWVSVPRKIFRTPSAATSSTVTPSATASTSAAAIPSPLNAPLAAVVGGGPYPKNECSNSLSFSDDNSSLQSSPWQRDHCWKQAAPRKNVSKELTLFYRRPAYHKLTTHALLLSHRKRRKPYDMKTLDNGSIFVLNSKKKIKLQQETTDDQQQEDKSTLDNKEEVESKEEVEKTNKIDESNETDEDKQEKDAKSIKSCGAEEVKTEIDDGENKNNDAKEGYDKSSDNKTIIKSEQENLEEIQDVDVEMTKLSSPCKYDDSEKTEKSPVVPKDTTKENEQVEKMNTSDYVNEEEANSTTSLNGHILKDVPQEQNEQHLNIAATQHGEKSKTGDEEKRLKKRENYKTRAKLATIVQKLMDASTSRLAATAHLFKTSNQTSALVASFATTPTSMSSSISSTSGGLTPGGTKNQNSKVSPPSNTAASRLVEYHQQHVSPRKRILREFEKVSLEDSTTGGAAGGKRSRAKGNTANMTTSNAIPSTSTISASNKSNSHSNLGITPKSATSSSSSAAPTKLYSSYSIHSLLGGGLSTSSSSTTQSSASKKSTDLPATITSNSLAYSPYHAASFPSNSHLNNSPKSPEGNNMMGGGKSPSNSKSKRSPPYNSPMRETHSKSPINSGGNGGYTDYSGRRSPRSTPDTAHNAFNKMRYTSSSGIETTASPSNHHLQHQQQPHPLQQQHYHQQPQTYYSPYMMSPHYVPPLSGTSALSPNATSANASTSSSRSPRHHTSAFRATTPTSTSSTSTTHNIPSSQKGDISPQRSTTASPRETTPRTVPKKTASIRRQFASPTSATQNHNNSNCSSPTTTIDSRSDEQLMSERKTPVNNYTSLSQHQQHQQPQHVMQRGSPGNLNLAGSPIHPYSYLYAQPPNSSNSPHTSNAAGSNHPPSAMSPSSANASVAAAAAAAAASYIPAVVGSPYYHPYISTLAAMRHPQMWMQHYQSAAAAAVNPALIQGRHPSMLSAAAARLSPPYGHSFQYNGVGNAAALAAAAAAAGFGSTATPPHHPSNALTHPSSMFNSMANSSLHGIQHTVPTMQTTAGLVPATAAAAVLSAASPMTDTTDSKSLKHNFSSSTSSSASSAGGASMGGLTAHGLSLSTGPSGNSLYTISNKDEQSSDVPLNLSKH